MFGSDRITPEVLSALGAGLSTGNHWSQQLGNASMGLQAANATAQEKAQLTSAANKTVAMLQAEAPELAMAVQNGIMTPSSAFGELMKRRQNAAEAAKPKFRYDNIAGKLVRTEEQSGESKLVADYSTPDLTPGQKEYNAFRNDPSYAQWLGDQKKAEAEAKNAPTSQDAFKTEIETRKTYRSEEPVKTYQMTRSGYEKVRTGAQLDTGQGDMALVYGFMKMLDPTSVVREGEYATAENSGGVSETVRNAYNKAMTGQRLSPEMRQKFVTAAEAQYQNTVKALEETNSQYTRTANEYGVPTDRFIESPKVYEPLQLGADPVPVALPDGTNGTIRRTK